LSTLLLAVALIDHGMLLREHAHQKLLLLLRNAVEDTDLVKQQQWKDFYSIMVAQGSLLGLKNTGAIHRWLQEIALISAPILLTVLGFSLVGAAQATLVSKRKLVDDGYVPLLDEPIKTLMQRNLTKAVKRHTYP
jgi:hypothetical protein